MNEKDVNNTVHHCTRCDTIVNNGKPFPENASQTTFTFNSITLCATCASNVLQLLVDFKNLDNDVLVDKILDVGVYKMIGSDDIPNYNKHE